MIRTKDHLPPHIHAVAPGAEAKIEIETLNVIWTFGYSKKTLNSIVEQVKINQELLLEVWNEIHGKKEN